MESTSVGAVAASSNIGHKSSSLINVDDDAQREEEGVEGEGGCSGIKNKTSSETQSRDENQEITHKSSLIPHILDIKNHEIPKRKRSQRKRKPKEPKKNSDSSQGERREGKESACDQIDSGTEAEEDNDADKPAEEEENTISEADLNQTVLGSHTANEEIVSESEDSLPLLEEAETEEEDVSESEESLPLLEESETEEEEEEDVSDASSCNWWNFTTHPRTCKRIRNVQWRKKKEEKLHDIRGNTEQPQDPSSCC